jgi:hypothetical protein
VEASIGVGVVTTEPRPGETGVETPGGVLPTKAVVEAVDADPVEVEAVTTTEICLPENALFAIQELAVTVEPPSISVTGSPVRSAAYHRYE